MRTDQGTARVRAATRVGKILVGPLESGKIFLPHRDGGPDGGQVPGLRLADGTRISDHPACRGTLDDQCPRTASTRARRRSVTVHPACPCETDLSDLIRHAHSRRQLSHSVSTLPTWNCPRLGRVRDQRSSGVTSGECPAPALGDRLAGRSSDIGTDKREQGGHRGRTGPDLQRVLRQVQGEA